MHDVENSTPFGGDSPEAIEEADSEALLAAHDEWVAAGRPGAMPHEDVMAELFGNDH
jgi:hypothetical protein